jgi:hypothetical protein
MECDDFCRLAAFIPRIYQNRDSGNVIGIKNTKIERDWYQKYKN